jgi:serine/threonine protein kinase
MDFPATDSSESNKPPAEVITRSKSTPSLRKVSLNDFKVKKLLGTGGYSKVVLAEHVGTKDEYALKILEKDFLVKVSSKMTL